MKGRKPKTIQQRILEGNRCGKPLPTDTPIATGRPRCPSWLSPDAKSEWARVVPELAKLGIVGRIDRGLLTGYCTAWALAVRTARYLDEHGVVDENGNKRPEATVHNESCTRLLRFACEIGLTPSGRTRLGLRRQESAEKSKLAEFMARKPILKIKGA